jgi:hypothetical protein
VAAVGGNTDAAGQILAGQARVGVAVRRATGDYVLHDTEAAAYLLVSEPDRSLLLPAAAASNRRPMPTLDELSHREAAELALSAVAEVAESFDAIHARGCVLVSALLTGIAEATRDMSVSYATTREQFGTPIGTFQAVKHRCADMGVAAALAGAQLTFAALSVAEGQPGAALEVAAARTVAHRAALSNCRETIQVHGGMGYTWECDAHLYLKRTHALRALFGRERDQRRVLLTAAT